MVHLQKPIKVTEQTYALIAGLLDFDTFDERIPDA